MTTQFKACTVAEVPRGTMIEASVSDSHKIIVAHTALDNWYATGGKCPHYGASLAKGVLCGERVTCPWHGAAFNLATGDIEEAPSFDALMTFPVAIVGDDVMVTLPDPLPKNFRREPTNLYTANDNSNNSNNNNNNNSSSSSSSSNDGVDNRRVLLVGGGAANSACAERLRQLGFRGEVTIVSGEVHLPYDRPKLSKALSSKPEAIALRSAEFYAANNIKLLLGHRVKQFDPVARVAVVDDPAQTRLEFDLAVLATGGDARLIRCDGYKLQGIFSLRNPEDSLAINAWADGDVKNVVIVGSSFIGMEVAACLKQAKKIERVTVVGMESAAFERVCGPEIGQALQQIHEKKGIIFRMERTIARYQGKNGKVTAVVLNGGEGIPADMVVVGAGVNCATDFLPREMIIPQDGSVMCDKYLRLVHYPHIFGAGDIVRYPSPHFVSELIRIEHWDVAIQHGRMIAQTIATGVLTPYDSVPFFWTQSFGTTIRFSGVGHGFDDIVIKGNLFELKFAAFFTRLQTIVAVMTVNVDPIAAAFSELLKNGKVPTKAQMQTLTLEDLSKL